METRLPEDIKRATDGYSRSNLPTVNHGGTVIELSSRGQSSLFLKIEARPSTLEQEVSRLHWLTHKLSVPQVIAFSSDATHDFLLLTAVPGEDATDDLPGLSLRDRVELIATGLRQIHEIDVVSCPFDRSLDAELRLARTRVDQGLVGEEDLEEHQKGRSIKAILDDLEERRPSIETAVFTHGDYSLPNIMIDQGQVSGFLDWRDGGFGDPYRNLPIVAKSIAKNWGEEWVDPFYKCFGLQDGLDQEKMEYYRLLYRFF